VSDAVLVIHKEFLKKWMAIVSRHLCACTSRSGGDSSAASSAAGATSGTVGDASASVLSQAATATDSKVAKNRQDQTTDYCYQHNILLVHWGACFEGEDSLMPLLLTSEQSQLASKVMRGAEPKSFFECLKELIVAFQPS